MSTVKERPILFSGPMVRAILDGSKTQTRRVVKEPREATVHGRRSAREWSHADPGLGAGGYLHWAFESADAGVMSTRVYCPFGSPGDRLWVRETFALSQFDVDAAFPPDTKNPNDWDGPVYRADGEHQGGGWTTSDGKGNVTPTAPPWRPSIHMPRWASRITLELTDVRVERLQAISEDDAKAEGAREIGDVGCPCEGDEEEPGPHLASCAWSHLDVDPDDCPLASAFALLWDGINGKRPGYSWDENPWVWVVEFRRVDA